jgi:chemotaxis protein MotB
MARNDKTPIIVKRRKVVQEDGHHGGAWKVAYADFVTAMMAFFLLMWLLNATTEKQRKGLADYFSPVVPINRISGGGDGSFYGDSVFATDELAYNGTGATDIRPTDENKASGDTGLDTTADEDEITSKGATGQAEDLLEELKARGGESMEALLESRHVVTRLTDEGLVLELRDVPDSLLFDEDNQPTYTLQSLLKQIADASQAVSNEIAVAAHLAAQPIVVADNPTWPVSSERALAAVDILDRSGLDMDRIKRVTGLGDRAPLGDDPMHITNSRVEIIYLRDDV